MLAVPLLSACTALLVPTPPTARAIEQPLTSPLTRRSVLALPLLLGAFPAPPAAAAELVAYFSAGDRAHAARCSTRSSTRASKCEVGTLGGVPAVGVSCGRPRCPTSTPLYPNPNPNLTPTLTQVSYKYVVGTSGGLRPAERQQFGEGPAATVYGHRGADWG